MIEYTCQLDSVLLISERTGYCIYLILSCVYNARFFHLCMNTVEKNNRDLSGSLRIESTLVGQAYVTMTSCLQTHLSFLFLVVLLILL